MASLVEIVLVTAQMCLWACGIELPEVPSLMRLNPWAVEADEDSDNDDWSDDDDDEEAARGPSGENDAANEPDEALEKASPRRGRSLSMSRLPPKNFDNSIFDTGVARSELKAKAKSQPVLYDPQEAYEWVIPVLAMANEEADHVAHV
ncbi:hypothetical protein AAVH_25210 [Aphelenchoides avenae]|nr:hypothetical protein AAVH_25210 [Aphelenchus avenae]